MEVLNEMHLEFLSCSENEAFARVVVGAFASQLNPTLEQLEDIKTAISEAVTNAIIHGYENSQGMVVINAWIKDKLLEVEVIDKGRGIENVQQAMQPLYTSRPELERSGMGFTVMETFMDKVKVKSVVGSGTKVHMVKRILGIQKDEERSQ